MESKRHLKRSYKARERRRRADDRKEKAETVSPTNKATLKCAKTYLPSIKPEAV